MTQRGFFVGDLKFTNKLISHSLGSAWALQWFGSYFDIFGNTLIWFQEDHGYFITKSLAAFKFLPSVALRR